MVASHRARSIRRRDPAAGVVLRVRDRGTKPLRSPIWPPRFASRTSYDGGRLARTRAAELFSWTNRVLHGLWRQVANGCTVLPEVRDTPCTRYGRIVKTWQSEETTRKQPRQAPLPSATKRSSGRWPTRCAV